jgi:hypothetical protein
MADFEKDPDAVLDYQVDWSTWLNGDTIGTSTWTVPAGITQNSGTANDATATIWLSGGSSGTTYALINRVVTAGGRTNDRTITVQVREA